MKKVGAVLVCLFLCVATLFAKPWTFKKIMGNPYPKHSGTHQGDMDVADINGDGLLDIVCVGLSHVKYSALVYTFNGTKFEKQEGHGLPVLDVGACIKLRDMDGDGDADVVVFGKEDSPSPTDAIFKIYANDGSGNFSELVDLGAMLPLYDDKKPDYNPTVNDDRIPGLYNALGFSAGGLEVEDLDNDGDFDILFAATKGMEKLKKGADDVYRDWEASGVFMNNGGTFVFKNNHGIVNTHRGATELADLNNDGNLDLILTGSENGESTFWSGSTMTDTQGDGLVVAKVYLGKGDGTFAEKANCGLQPNIDGSIRAYEINGDGKMDIILLGSVGTTTAANGGRFTGVYLGNGDGTFSLDSSQKLKPLMSGDSAMGDIDGDGDADLVLSGNDNSQVILFYENKNGTFQAKRLGYGEGYSSADGMKVSDLNLIDIDGDGDLDLIANGQAGGSFLLVYGNTLK